MSFTRCWLPAILLPDYFSNFPRNGVLTWYPVHAYRCRGDLTVEDQRRQELYKASKPHYYDAILMDVRMPVMDGITAAKPFHLSY